MDFNVTHMTMESSACQSGASNDGGTSLLPSSSPLAAAAAEGGEKDGRGGDDVSSGSMPAVSVGGFHQDLAQAVEMKSAAQLLASAKMSGGNSMDRGEDPSASMLRYQSSRPDLSPAAPKQLVSPKHEIPFTSTAVSNQSSSHFIFDGYAGWVCRHCSHLDHYYRGPNFVWVSGSQPPPDNFIEAHLRLCPALNQPWAFGAATTAAAYNRKAPLQLQTPQQLFPGAVGGDKVEEKGNDMETSSRKREHEAPDPPDASDTMSKEAPAWPQHNVAPFFPQWPSQFMPTGTIPASHGAIRYPPPPPDHLTGGKIPSIPHTMQGSKGGPMPPPPEAGAIAKPPTQPGVIHTGSFYSPTDEDVVLDFSPNRRKTSQKKGKPLPIHKGIKSNEYSYATALALLRKKAEETPKLTSSRDDVTLIEETDSKLLTDYFYFIILQLAVCRFTEKDRKTRGGKRQDVAVGYGGLQCIHCASAPYSRKFFWANVDRLANSFAGIPEHVLTCKMCPEEITNALLVLKGRHNSQMALLPRGAQKQFFRRMWKRIHAGDDIAAAASFDSGGTRDDGTELNSPKPESNDAEETLKKSTLSSRESHECVLLAVPQDKDWLSDSDCFVRKQVEVFCASSTDIENAESESSQQKPGQVGLRCIHCAKSQEGARGDAVRYPHSVSGIYESVRGLHAHFLVCPNLPEESKNSMSDEMTGSSNLSSNLRRYYVEAAGALGLFDSDEGGIMAGGRVIPLLR